MANLLSRYGKIIGGGSPREEMIAPVELSTTASQAYEIGEQFILNGTLYTATAAITAGGTVTIGGNCTASDSVTEQIAELHNNTYGTSVSINAGTNYTTLADGYVSFNGSATQTILLMVNSQPLMQSVPMTNGGSRIYTLFVKKGMTIKMTNGNATFRPFI